MGKAKFTPGPWVAVYRGDHGGGEEGDVHQKEKWDADPFDSGFMRGEFTWPDACLIAAAPELYEALDILVELIDSADLGWSLITARAALAKARGKTP